METGPPSVNHASLFDGGCLCLCHELAQLAQIYREYIKLIDEYDVLNNSLTAGYTRCLGSAMPGWLPANI